MKKSILLLAVAGMFAFGATSCGGDEACCEKDGKECTKECKDKHADGDHTDADHEAH